MKQEAMCCSNCKNFYLFNLPDCLNCGFNPAQATLGAKWQRIHFARRDPEVQFRFRILALCLLIAGGLARLTENDPSDASSSHFVSLGLWALAALSLSASVWLAVALSPFMEETEPFTPDSLLGWQEKLNERLAANQAKLQALNELLLSRDLTKAEKSSFPEAIALLAAANDEIEQKIISFKILRWQNKIEKGFEIIYSPLPEGADGGAKRLKESIQTLNWREKDGADLLELKLSPDNKQAVRTTLRRIRRLSQELTRQNALKILQSVKLQSSLLEMPERRELAARLQLAEGMQGPVTSEMFEREKIRLAIARVLTE